MIDLFKTEIENEKKVLILGFGKEGRSTFRWIKNNFPHLQIGISDKNPSALENIAGGTDISFFSGENYLNSIDNYKIIIKSPGIKTNDDFVKNKKILTQTGLFIKRFSKQIIGVTGTKGKSTTASLIAFFLNKYGKNAVLLGNIGTPAFDMLNEINDRTIIVYELSAHQLNDVKHSPHIGILLNIFPEHLDFFGNFDNYKKAKLNIFKFQNRNGISINGEEFQNLGYSNETLKIAAEHYLGKRDFLKKLTDTAPVAGNHNLFNVITAMSAVQHYGITPEMCLKVLPKFNPLPHRLELVAEVNGVKYYNDSISTIPQATIEAVKSLKNVDVLILGGYNRGIDYKPLTDFILTTEIKHIFFTGDAGKVMYNILKSNTNGIKLNLANNLNEAMRQITNLSGINTVLLSPAAASYDAFHNFEHRGDTFRMLVSSIAKEKTNR